MILPHCRIVNHENEASEFSGLDSLQYCLDKNHFRSYPDTIKYHYNSRGFRGPEWPENTDNAIWCIGDSFTVGLGVPEHHTWPYLLSKATGRLCINVSMDGASNSWIGRWAQEIISTTNANTVVVHWSYTHRRERPMQEVRDEIWQDYYNAVKGPTWPDCNSETTIDQLPAEIQQQLQQDPRYDCYTQGFDLESLARLHSINSTIDQDAVYTSNIVANLEENKLNCKVLHSHIPQWHPWNLSIHYGQWIKEFTPVDRSRDGLHYGQDTANLLVSRILEILEV